MTPLRRRSLLLAGLALLALTCLPACGIVWWGAAAVGLSLSLESSGDGDDGDSDDHLPPTLSTPSASQGQETGGQTVTLNGTNFLPGARRGCRGSPLPCTWA